MSECDYEWSDTQCGAAGTFVRVNAGHDVLLVCAVALVAKLDADERDAKIQREFNRAKSY